MAQTGGGLETAAELDDQPIKEETPEQKAKREARAKQRKELAEK